MARTSFPASVSLCLSLSLAALLLPSDTRAAGYLWLGAEFSGEGNIYRFNLQTNTIDKVMAHAGSDHWNNVTSDGTYLYLGHPTTQTFNRHDAYTGDLVATGTHSASLGGHKEDGAFFEGSLWRMTYSGSALHRMTTAGVLETTLTAPSALVGLEFVNGQGYATNYSSGTIGRLTRDGTTWGFVPAVWRAGFAPSGGLGGLAYDPGSGTLYMATESNLYRIEIAQDTAKAILVVSLPSVGYPSGGLPDGMCWVALEGTSSVEPPSARGAAIELGAPWPSPARDGVWFDVNLSASGPVHVGIYDLAGRRQRAWDLPQFGAGRSRFHWDLKGRDGTPVPPGQYFIRLEAQGQRAVRSFTRLE